MKLYKFNPYKLRWIAAALTVMYRNEVITNEMKRLGEHQDFSPLLLTEAANCLHATADFIERSLELIKLGREMFSSLIDLEEISKMNEEV